MHQKNHSLVLYGFLSLMSLTFSTVGNAATPVNLRQVTPQVFQTLGVDHTSYKTFNTAIDFNKTKHERFQQYYQGYRVWGADGVKHVTKTSLATYDGTIYQNISPDLQSASPLVFDKSQMEKAVREAQRISKGDPEHAKTEIVVHIDKANKAHWAYLVQFSMSSQGLLYSKPVLLLDAETLDVLAQWNEVEHLDGASGGGFGGNKKMGKLVYDGAGLPSLTIQRDASNQTCFLANNDVIVKDKRARQGIAHYPCSQLSKEHNNVFWNENFDAINGAYSPSNDALEVGSIVKNMYQTWYGIPVLTQKDKPMQLNMVVHENMENAYWNGKEMVFGDGGSMFYPLVSIGVGAHEISHGFTEQHSNLKYYSQSGGLNESFSDMAAVAANYFSSGHAAWHIGEEIMKEDGALRYMEDPTKDCGPDDMKGMDCSIDNAKDFREEEDVHYTSGVFNKLFYLLSTSKGWTVRKAFDVMVQANRHYWTSTSDFANAACGVELAAKDYGYDASAVVNAASAVGIPAVKC